MAGRFRLRIGNLLDAPASKRYYNQEVFAEIAPRYDFITRALSLGRDAFWKRDLIAALPELKTPLAVDLACGTGDLTFLLAEAYPQGTVVGVDLTASMLKLARVRTAFSNVWFACQDMGKLALAAGSADIVTGGYALRNAPELESAIREIHRVLKPGGVAAFLDFSKPPGELARRCQYWLLKLWGGFWGYLFHRNTEVYGYIAESLKRHPNRLQLQKMFWENGFEVVYSRLYFRGVTELLVVRRG